MMMTMPIIKQTSLDELIKFLKEDGAGGFDGFAATDVGTPTYGSNTKRKKLVQKAEEVVFTSIEDDASGPF